MRTIKVHISTIRQHDTIKCLDGFVRTVGAKDIKYSDFMGVTLFGDTYNLGTILVSKVNI